ncbi:unnamed protein product [Didymodactylos carnosus]|uniref:Cyclic nucleotide-binding domain-containing protein n=1 Tax=Didymodactylos carnosus TaxID=1234261 RepID=A0A814HTX5_9BILA|nr:unnamed protein product [Didymodactylos carnosus]CAF1039751.1 unnamed protein product [Didymodactylos carnosus]CAF3786948.1 unnamed protein product [Didymodactylos carnosus]CAF3807943.1 unnamed protein product [Didymodactylos carnosus]
MTESRHSNGAFSPIWTTEGEAYVNSNFKVENDSLIVDDILQSNEPYLSRSFVSSYSNPTYECLRSLRPSQTSSIGEQLRHLRQRFNDRTEAIKEKIHQAPDDGETSIGSDKPVQHRSAFSDEAASGSSSNGWQASSKRQFKVQLKKTALSLLHQSGIRQPVDTDIDCLSILPLDLFYIIFGRQAVFRLPRLLKFQSLNDFFKCCDRWVQSFFASLKIVKIFVLVLWLVLWVHLYACVYILFSNYERSRGADNNWVYKHETNPRMSAYSYSFYYCFKIASTIGNIPDPETLYEYLFVTVGYLFALFIFALLIGQIRDVFQSMNQRRADYQNKVENVMIYLKKFELPTAVQDRVRMWFQYNWHDRNTLEDDDKTLAFLPTTLQTELAISIHYDILSKVDMFQGEIGREMYIVNHGVLDVFIGDKKVSELKEGKVFGEISLLEVAGGNRRTADVISRGFSTLFTLHKLDLNEALKDFPEAGRQLRKKAKKMMKRSPDVEKDRKHALISDNEIHAEPIIVDCPKHHPKLLDTVMRAVGKESKLIEVLNQPRKPSLRLTSSNSSVHSFDIKNQKNDIQHQAQVHKDSVSHHGQNLLSQNSTTKRVKSLRTKLFSNRFQNLPSSSVPLVSSDRSINYEDEQQQEADDFNYYIKQQEHRKMLTTSETSVTLVFSEDIV